MRCAKMSSDVAQYLIKIKIKKDQPEQWLADIVHFDDTVSDSESGLSEVNQYLAAPVIERNHTSVVETTRVHLPLF